MAWKTPPAASRSTAPDLKALISEVAQVLTVPNLVGGDLLVGMVRQPRHQPPMRVLRLDEHPRTRSSESSGNTPAIIQSVACPSPESTVSGMATPAGLRCSLTSGTLGPRGPRHRDIDDVLAGVHRASFRSHMRPLTGYTSPGVDKPGVLSKMSLRHQKGAGVAGVGRLRRRPPTHAFGAA